jgi:RNA polymerase sigma-70 factor (ECF subfamily)
MHLTQNRGKARQAGQELQQALNGDREALGLLFESQMPQLYRVALRILGTPQNAEEALQDGFLCAIRHLGEFECRSRFSTWLTRIVINSALMRLRKNRREVLTSFDQSFDPGDLELVVALTDTRPNPEEICVWKERFEMFEREMRNLPAVYQSILWLRDVQGMSTQEAAEILGVKCTTVKSQLHRARMRLGMVSSVASTDHRLPQTIWNEAGEQGLQSTAELMEEVDGKAA